MVFFQLLISDEHIHGVSVVMHVSMVIQVQDELQLQRVIWGVGVDAH